MHYANPLRTVNTLWPSDAIWCLRSWSIMVQVMACCLTAASHYQNQSWFTTRTPQLVGFCLLSMKSSSINSRVMFKWILKISPNHCGPSDVILQQRSWPPLVQVMACCFMAPSHNLNQCWLMTNKAPWHSPKSYFTASDQATALYNKFENHTFKIKATSPRGQWQQQNKTHQNPVHIPWTILYVSWADPSSFVCSWGLDKP